VSRAAWEQLCVNVLCGRCCQTQHVRAWAQQACRVQTMALGCSRTAAIW
jgi:uncharacterized cysteine cluster protein YcgN (CxxCxxCC family)